MNRDTFDKAKDALFAIKVVQNELMEEQVVPEYYSNVHKELLEKQRLERVAFLQDVLITLEAKFEAI